MKTRSQIFLALTMVVLSTGAVVVLSAGSQEQEEAMAGMEGHDHSTMSGGGGEAQPVTLSVDAARRIGVTFATVTRGTLPLSVSTVGSVAYDETRLTTVSPKIEGWVEKLYVDFTGAVVRAGDPLLDLYSPALVTAQEELLLARRLLQEAQQTGGDRTKANAEELLAAARRRLAYWDIPAEEIQALEERGTVTKTLTLRAPSDGIVLEKRVVEGSRLAPGMEVFRVADLGRVWVEAEVFEKDLSLVELGQHAMVSFEAYPGETFHGAVTYVYPTVSAATRTGRIRLELPNPQLRIRPGMYARVELHGVPVAETLLVPRSAVLETGERTIVFHRMASGQLHPMEVVTGLRSDDQIQVLSGLQEGQVVVASATFLIDAESNLGAAMAGMAGMAGMDHSGMDMGGESPADTSMEGMDHSGMDMGSVQPADTGMAGMDHSQHQMGGPVPDTTGGR